MKETIRCPKCDEELFTDGSYLSTIPYKRTSDKPDPQADGDGEIVKLAIRWLSAHMAYSGGKFDREALEAFARAIKAGIQNNNQLFTGLYDEVIPDLEQKIEAVRKLFRNHEGRLKSQKTVMEGNFDAIAGQFKDVLRTIEGLANWQCRHPELHKSLERKVEELEKRLKCKKVVELLRAEQPKPQPFPEQSRGVARDKDGHLLIPGVSVVRHDSMGDIALFTEDCGRGIKGYWLTAKKDLHKDSLGKLAWLTRGEYTWLFDLDFPSFAKAQDMKGGTQ